LFYTIKLIPLYRREGLVLKNPNLVYNLNSKDGAWLKIKPEYMDGMTENSDLIVVGKCHIIAMKSINIVLTLFL
jgi:hypothetical protein